MAYKCNIFKNYTKLDKPRIVKMGDHNIQKGIGIGDVHFNMRHGKFGILSKVLHVPEFKKKKLLSISKISDLGFTVNFDRERFSIFNNQMKQIAWGTSTGNLYSLSDIPVNNDVSLNSTTSEIEKAILWHKRLGHTSSIKLSEMKSKNLVKGLENCVFDKTSICEACIKGKHKRQTFPISQTKSS